MEWVITKENTKTEAGVKHQECKTCGYKGEDVEIPADPSLGDGDGHKCCILWWLLLLLILIGIAITIYIIKRKKAKR